MTQTTATTAAATSNLLQLHHNFRWIICSNHSQPVSGFLQRYLRRRLIAAGTGKSRTRCAEAEESAGVSRPARDDGDDHHDDDDDDTMTRVVDWLPRAWQQINHFIETRCATADVTIGMFPIYI